MLFLTEDHLNAEHIWLGTGSSETILMNHSAVEAKPEVRRELMYVLKDAENNQTADERAWTLRRGLDAVRPKLAN